MNAYLSHRTSKNLEARIAVYLSDFPFLSFPSRWWALAQ